MVLLGLTALGGIVFVHRPAPNRFAAWGFAHLSARLDDPVLLRIAWLGSLRVLVIAIVLCGLVSLVRDRRRALSCLLGPLASVLVTERVAKPLVARHVSAFGATSYPSGTVTAIAALASIVVLISPARVKFFTVPLGGACVVAVSIAVVALRWHFPTDTLGGIGVGCGGVLAFDAGLHLFMPRRAQRRGHLPEPAVISDHDSDAQLSVRLQSKSVG
jgi:membrane-associated phospholipid phosphatase